MRQVIVLINRLRVILIEDLESIKLSKSPILVGILLVYAATIFMQYNNKLSLKSIIIFTIVMIIHLLLYLFSNVIFKNKYWLYFIIQGIIIFDCAVIMPTAYESIFLGLIPVLIFQSTIMYYNAIKVIVTSVFYYGVFCVTIVIYDGTKELVRYIPILVLITIAVRAFSAIYIKQVKLRVQSQKVLKELELAYEKVEELTLINERQRMARDLHDTLSQGLAGVIMQLDAADANLNNNNVKRAQEIIQRAMEHARNTLSDSRLVIHDLRFPESADIDFSNAIEKEIAAFKAVSHTFIITDITVESQISQKIIKHVLYILREGLNNIAKHARAKNATVKIAENKNELNINISDDGIGFEIRLLDKLFGHYGILGMTERVKAINGEIKIESKKRIGTNIKIRIPIGKEIN